MCFEHALLFFKWVLSTYFEKNKKPQKIKRRKRKESESETNVTQGKSGKDTEGKKAGEETKNIDELKKVT